MSNFLQTTPPGWNGSSKRCLDCGEVKPLDDFPPAKRRLDGRGSYCRPCYGIRSKASYRRRRERDDRTVRDPRIAPEGHKWCPDCESFKPVAEFGRNRSSRDGRTAYCKPCHNKRGRENRIKNHGSTREFHLRRRYGIGQADFDRLLATQSGKCAVCRKLAPDHVDHDHETGEVRGILCFNCNQALGNVRDNLQVLDQLSTYLTLSKNAGYAPVRAYLPPHDLVIEYAGTHAVG